MLWLRFILCQNERITRFGSASNSSEKWVSRRDFIYFFIMIRFFCYSPLLTCLLRWLCLKQQYRSKPIKIKPHSPPNTQASTSSVVQPVASTDDSCERTKPRSSWMKTLLPIVQPSWFYRSRSAIPIMSRNITRLVYLTESPSSNLNRQIAHFLLLWMEDTHDLVDFAELQQSIVLIGLFPLTCHVNRWRRENLIFYKYFKYLKRSRLLNRYENV